jgi:hypothetical protein
MEAAIVGGLFIGVAGGTGNFLGSRFVRGTLNVGVAVDASEHAAVDGIFKMLRVDMQADWFAVLLMG